MLALRIWLWGATAFRSHPLSAQQPASTFATRGSCAVADAHRCRPLCVQALPVPPTPNSTYRWSKPRSILDQDNNGYTL